MATVAPDAPGRRSQTLWGGRGPEWGSVLRGTSSGTPAFPWQLLLLPCGGIQNCGGRGQEVSRPVRVKVSLPVWTRGAVGAEHRSLFLSCSRLFIRWLLTRVLGGASL